ncbi:hypothetical protein [Leptothoe sp. PORK10 BA2]|uniref:hypothetical protein n=1 Tax=Leptothoe sp. PORK10 BA2 TaxID=3110254 RepID=UPI002B1F02DB|nr:hypothetical protein [Leptothoe sp. PORK10 BA2]MEA5464556.1 hypothetical protein [Leptothoe sp. PORK10 BA2]
MVHGLLWLPLLIFFFWITWAGWNEYKKVETYKQWATQFERAKYDIYAALGQSAGTLTWGLPTRQGIVNIQRTQLDQVCGVDLLIKGDTNFKQVVQGPAKKGDAVLHLRLTDQQPCQIPFTDAELAKQWHQFLTTTVTAMTHQEIS